MEFAISIDCEHSIRKGITRNMCSLYRVCVCSNSTQSWSQQLPFAFVAIQIFSVLTKISTKLHHTESQYIPIQRPDTFPRRHISFHIASAHCKFHIMSIHQSLHLIPGDVPIISWPYQYKIRYEIAANAATSQRDLS